LEERKGNHQPRVFEGWTFQAIDFSPMPLDEWNTYDFAGALFLGCAFPVADLEVQRMGGEGKKNCMTVKISTLFNISILSLFPFASFFKCLLFSMETTDPISV
jgi:hypothetical protein